MAYVNTAKAQDILKGTKICDKCEDNLIAPMEMIFNDDFRQMAIPIVDDVENNPKYSGKKCIDVLIESKNDFVYRLKLLMFDDDFHLYEYRKMMLQFHQCIPMRTKLQFSYH